MTVLRRLAALLLSICLLTACATTRLAIVPTSSPAPTSTPMPTPTSTLPLLIVTLGDSLTQGDKDESSQGGGWPRRLLPLMQQVRPQTRIVNLAQPGWTLRDLLKGVGDAPNQIDRAVQILREASGDKIATVWIGTNDLFYLYEFGNPTSIEEAREADRFERDLDDLLDRMSNTGARVFIALLHDPSRDPVQTSGVFMSTTAAEWQQMSQQAQRYNEGIKTVAAKYDATLVDIPDTQIFNTPTLMYADGIHPNAHGYDELAKVWWNAIRDTKTR
jgi:lysophospholipase L1-like esterase